MTAPVILWRESFGYGSIAWSQVYLSVVRSTNNNFGSVQVGFEGSLAQWGRGSGADMGYASKGGYAGLRATTLGFADAVDTSAHSIGVAFAFQQAGNVGGSVLCEFWDDDGHGNGTFDVPLLHLSIETLADGRICAKNGTGSGSGGPGTIIGISTTVLPVGLNGANGNFTHIEIVPPASGQLIHASNGGVRVYADGTLVLDLSGVSTRNSLGGSGKVGYVQPLAFPARIFTDLVIHDCSGTGRIGDKRVSYRHATAAGTYTAGTAVGDSTRVLCVDDQACDGDTTYINFDDTSLPKAASFTCQAMPAETSSIDEVTPLVILRKSDASADTNRTVLISNATEVDNGADRATPAGYNVSTLVGPAPGYQVDPHTSAAWTIANCDAAEVGARRIA
jgi:hypothetical protein